MAMRDLRALAPVSSAIDAIVIPKFDDKFDIHKTVKVIINNFAQ
jgi:citrate lyase beta subunit